MPALVGEVVLEGNLPSDYVTGEQLVWISPNDNMRKLPLHPVLYVGSAGETRVSFKVPDEQIVLDTEAPKDWTPIGADGRVVLLKTKLRSGQVVHINPPAGCIAGAALEFDLRISDLRAELIPAPLEIERLSSPPRSPPPQPPRPEWQPPKVVVVPGPPGVDAAGIAEALARAVKDAVAAASRSDDPRLREMLMAVTASVRERIDGLDLSVRVQVGATPACPSPQPTPLHTATTVLTPLPPQDYTHTYPSMILVCCCLAPHRMAPRRADTSCVFAARRCGRSAE